MTELDIEEWKLNPVITKKIKDLMRSEKFPYEIFPRILYKPYIYSFDRKKNRYVKEKLSYKDIQQIREPDIKSEGISYFSRSDDKETVFFTKINGKEEVIFTFPSRDAALLLAKDEIYLIRDNQRRKFVIWKKNKEDNVVDIHFFSSTVKLSDNTILEMRAQGYEIHYKFHYLINEKIHTSREYIFHLSSYIGQIKDIEAINTDLVILISGDKVISLYFGESLSRPEERIIFTSGLIDHSGTGLRISGNFFILLFGGVLKLYWCNGKSSHLVQTISKKSSFPRLLPPDKEELKNIGNLLELPISDDLRGVIVNYLISDYNDTIK